MRKASDEDFYQECKEERRAYWQMSTSERIDWNMQRAKDKKRFGDLWELEEAAYERADKELKEEMKGHST